MRRFFRSTPAEEVPGKGIDAQKATRRRVEIQVERETVSVFHSPGVVQTDGHGRCMCCGQPVAMLLPVCVGVEIAEIDALPGEVSGSPAKTITLLNPKDEVK